ncbi:MAG: murein biosynthesis integral rane protein MurJ [Verrucomicrobiota bacterium]|jgi:putative peptidoglycan lipid II flippase
MSEETKSTTSQPDTKPSVGTMGLVSLAVLSSRLLGLLREILLAAFFGGENRKWYECFLTAFRLPNMLRDLFAEGALSTAFVTTFSKTHKTDGEEAAWSLARKMVTLTAVFMSLISLLGIVFAPWIVRAMSPGWVKDNADKVDYAIFLAQIMYPFILLVSLAALVMGMLNARKVFGIPAMASTFFNIFSIIFGAGLGWWFDPHFGKTALIGVSIGTLIGGLAQLVVQLPSLRRVGFRFRPDFAWRDPGVKKVLQLMVPSVISGSVVQFNVFLNSCFASYIVNEMGKTDGPQAWLNYSFRLIQLPLGIFGVVIATVTLPAISRLATEGVTDAFKETLARSLKLVFLMTLPSAVGMAILAEEIIGVIYQHGRFDDYDTAMTALALRTYAWGLIFYAGIKIVQPAFYAIDRRFVPVLVSVVAVAVSAVSNWICVHKLHLGHEYLALGTSLSAFVNFTLLMLALRRIGGPIQGSDLFSNMLKLLVSSAMLALVCWGAKQTVLTGFHHQPLYQQIVVLCVTIGVAAGVYFGMNIMLKNKEVSEFSAILKRKFLRK